MKKILISTILLNGLFVSNSLANENVNLNNGLIAHYEFENNANDSSGNKNDGTEYGGVTYVNGVIGKAANFDGIDDWIKLDDNIEFINLNYTISVFIKPNNFGVKSYTSSSCSSTIFANRFRAHKDGSDINSGVYLSTSEGSNCDGNASITGSFIGKNSNNYNTINYDLDDNIDKWLNYTFIRDGKEVKIYINGLFISSNNVSNEEIKYNKDFPVSSIGANIVSDYSDTKLFFLYDGLMDDLRVYNRALNEIEIQELYKLGGGTINNNCIQQIIYGKSPKTGTWIPFPTSCDVPKNWKVKNTEPTDFNRTAIGLPPKISIDKNTTTIFNAGFKAGQEYILNNLNEYNSSISNITKTKIDILSNGWHLLGTGSDINNTSIFNNINSVWKYQNNWKAYSPNIETQSLIKTTPNIDILYNMEADKGFWIYK